MVIFFKRVAVHAQKHLEVIIEHPVETAQRHILHAFFLMHEGGQVLVRPHIRVIGLLDAVNTYPFPVFLVVLPEKGEQGKRLLPDALHRILHQLRRDKTKAVLYPPVMPLNLGGQVVYGPVHGHGICAAAVGASLFRVPDGRIDRYLCADLLPFGVYADFAQQLAGSVLADFCAVDIEQYRKGTAVSYVIVVGILFHIHGF